MAALGISGQFDGMEIDGKCKKDGGWQSNDRQGFEMARPA
jgi:hypothetical protein